MTNLKNKFSLINVFNSVSLLKRGPLEQFELINFFLSFNTDLHFCILIIFFYGFLFIVSFPPSGFWFVEEIPVIYVLLFIYVSLGEDQKDDMTYTYDDACFVLNFSNSTFCTNKACKRMKLKNKSNLIMMRHLISRAHVAWPMIWINMQYNISLEFFFDFSTTRVNSLTRIIAASRTAERRITIFLIKYPAVLILSLAFLHICFSTVARLRWMKFCFNRSNDMSAAAGLCLHAWSSIVLEFCLFIVKSSIFLTFGVLAASALALIKAPVICTLVWIVKGLN